MKIMPLYGSNVSKFLGSMRHLNLKYTSLYTNFSIVVKHSSLAPGSHFLQHALTAQNSMLVHPVIHLKLLK